MRLKWFSSKKELTLYCSWSKGLHYKVVLRLNSCNSLTVSPTQHNSLLLTSDKIEISETWANQRTKSTCPEIQKLIIFWFDLVIFHFLSHYKDSSTSQDEIVSKTLITNRKATVTATCYVLHLTNKTAWIKRTRYQKQLFSTYKPYHKEKRT